MPRINAAHYSHALTVDSKERIEVDGFTNKGYERPMDPDVYIEIIQSGEKCTNMISHLTPAQAISLGKMLVKAGNFAKTGRVGKVTVE